MHVLRGNVEIGDLSRKDTLSCMVGGRTAREPATFLSVHGFKIRTVELKTENDWNPHVPLRISVKKKRWTAFSMALGPPLYGLISSVDGGAGRNEVFSGGDLTCGGMARWSTGLCTSDCLGA